MIWDLATQLRALRRGGGGKSQKIGRLRCAIPVQNLARNYPELPHFGTGNCGKADVALYMRRISIFAFTEFPVWQNFHFLNT